MTMQLTPNAVKASAIATFCALASQDGRPAKGGKALDHLCRTAIKVLQADLDACLAHSDATDEAEARRPLYPSFHPLPPSRTGPSSVRLKADLKKYDVPGPAQAQWRKQQRAQIRDVLAWEKEVRAVDRSVRLPALARASATAGERARRIVERVAKTPAHTALELACKAAVFEKWNAAGYGYHEEGLALVESILFDARMLGTGGPLRGQV